MMPNDVRTGIAIGARKTRASMAAIVKWAGVDITPSLGLQP